MNSHLLYGENQLESRNKLALLMSQFEKKGWEIIKVDGQKDTPDLNVLSHTSSMFGLGRLLVVENYFSFNKKGLQSVKDLLQKSESGIAYIFWESKTIAPQTARAISKYLGVEEFKIPKTLFYFLGSCFPKNAKNSLFLLQKARKENPPDMLIIMLSRQIRLLYCVLTDSKNLTLLDWQKRNLEQQAKKFRPEQLLRLHGQLLDLDRKNKRSQLPEDLGASLDLLVASL